MGHSQAEKMRSHKRIVQLAAERFREMGVDGVSVADLMKEAGLTHGGFYRHFPCRDDLVAEAVEEALANGSQIADRAEKLELSALITGYLSVAHRDSKARGCAVPALATDIARSNSRARSAYTAQVSRYLDLLGRLNDDTNDNIARKRAIMTLSALVGAVCLARAVDDDALSKEILEATSDVLIMSAGANREP